MKLTHITPMIWTREISATIDFYTNILGFTCASYDESYGWASLYRDDVSIMISKPNEHTPFQKPLFTGTFYFQTDNVEAIWEQLKGKTNICYPLETFEWGMREFAIYDNNGYILQFGQEMDNMESAKK